MRPQITVVAKKADTFFAERILDLVKASEGWDCSACTFDELEGRAHAGCFVAIFESMTYEEILNACDYFRKHNLRALYISAWEHKLILGPTHFPYRTAAADSCLFILEQERLGRLPTKEELCSIATREADAGVMQANPEIMHLLMSDLTRELKFVMPSKGEPKFRLVDAVLVYDLNESASERAGQLKYIHPLFEKHPPENGSGPAYAFGYPILLSKFAHSKVHLDRNLFFNRPGQQPADEYQSVAIIGGGTAGYLTALSLKKAYPALPVTLIESSKIPVIGVGEATTPDIRRFLFKSLGLSPVDFYQQVKPTWKLGIKFFWGLPGDYFFNYPFGKSDIRSSYILNNHINYSSLSSLLMSNDSSFVTSRQEDEGKDVYASLSQDIPYALHMDNVSFIRYLKTVAAAMGVEYIDDLITDAEKHEELGGIKVVIGESGKRYHSDFFVDCTGFRSLLLEKNLKSPYIPYHNSLFTDTAVTGCIHNANKVRPYTYAESMNNGWCWNIPMRGEDHRGYVFSSAFCSVEEATRELQLKNPAISDFRTVKFRSGRHERICIGNVFAVGNSYAFVEPLESTGIHMIVKEAETLTANFPYLKKSPSIRAAINKNMNDHWDYLKGFLSIHYKFNKKFDTPFWKECRHSTDVSSVQWLIDLYHELGLLSYTDSSFQQMITKEIKDDIFALLGFDTLLLGQGEIPRKFDRSLRNMNIWKSNVSNWRAIDALTVPLEKDLAILMENPHLI